MKTLHILGEDINIKFNLAVQVMYEKVTDTAFTLNDMKNTSNMLALIFSVISVSNKNTGITMDKLMEDLSFAEMTELNKAVSEVMTEWYKIPAPATEGESKPEEGEQGKNA